MGSSLYATIKDRNATILPSPSRGPIPSMTADDYTAWKARMADPDFFRPLVAEVLQRENLGSGTDVVSAIDTGSSGVYRLQNPPVIIKFPPPSDPAAIDRESTALAALESVPDVPTPQLLGRGRTEQSRSHYLVISALDGQPLTTIWDGMSAAEQRKLAAQLGNLARRLHEAPTLDDSAHRRWQQFVNERIHVFTTGAEEHYLPDQLYRQARQFVLDNASLASATTPTFVHADLQGAHILVDNHRDTPQITGIIDFGDSIPADTVYDFLIPYIDAFEGNRTAWNAFINGYGRPIPNLTDRWLLYAFLHRFPFLGAYGLKHWDISTLDDLRAAISTT